MTWEDDVSLEGLQAELRGIRELMLSDRTGNEHEYRDRAYLLQHIRSLRPHLVKAIRDKKVPYPSNSDPDKLAVVMRAKLEVLSQAAREAGRQYAKDNP